MSTQAMMREAKEEVGIDLLPGDLELVHVSYRPKHDNTDNRVDFFFRTRTWGGEIKNMEPNKCDDLKWVSLDELPENMTPHVRDAAECMREGVFFKELGIDFLKKESRSPRGFLPRPLLRTGESEFHTPPPFPQKNEAGCGQEFRSKKVRANAKITPPSRI